jgi:hypothetical protein
VTAGARAREFRAIQARRAEEEADLAAALQQAEGASTVQGLAVTLWHQAEECRQELAAAHDREAALRAALQDTQRRNAVLGAQVARLQGEAESHEVAARTAQAERDRAMAGEDAACRREAATLRRLQAAEARLAQAGTAPPPLPAQVETVGQAEPMAVRQWVRTSRSLRAWHDVPAERYAADDAAALRRQVWRLLRQESGAARASMAERARELLRALGGE